MIKGILTLCLLLISIQTHAALNLSPGFKKILDQKKELNRHELKRLQQYDIYFIPGLFAESLIREDRRSVVDFSIITKDYFGEQIKLLQNQYHLNAHRLSTSSYNVEETKANIREALATSYQNKRKAILISHSLGGLVLLEELVSNPQIQENIAGIIFLQSPFFGSPLGEVLLDPPYHLEKLLHPLLPYVNISEDTIEYVSPKSRKKFMDENQHKIEKLIKRIPLYTFSSSAPANRSFFKPLIDIMSDGCIKGIKLGCISEVFYAGPYDESDGLIPVKSSFIPGADFVFLKNVDHGEIILRLPFEDYKKEHLTTTWLKVLLSKIK